MSNPLKPALGMALSLTMAAWAEPPAVVELAPESTILVMGVSSAQSTLERLKRTPMWELWQSEQMLEMRAEVAEEMEEGIDEMLQELGLERDTVQPPTGALGLAVFMVEDEELMLPGLGFLLMADYGENADATAELFDAAMKKAEEEGELDYEEREVMGRTVRCFPLAVGEETDEPADDEAEADIGAQRMGAAPDPKAMFEQFMSELYFVREGSAFMLCSHMPTLTSAFEVCDGAEPMGLPRREDFRAIMQQVGANDGYGALLTRDLGPLIAAYDPSMMMMSLGPMLGQFIGDIRGFGMGVRVDGPVAMLEQTMSVYMPNGKVGLTALMDTETPRGEVPGFVGSNTLSYTAMNFEFDGMPALIQRVMQMLPFLAPPPQQGQEDAPTPQEMIAQVFSCFGRKVYMLQTLDRPIAMDSLKQVTAIECVKPEELDSFLSAMGPQMGMEGRDFSGRRIYTMDMGGLSMMAPVPAQPAAMGETSMSVGIGGSLAFMGPTSAVEEVMRLVGDAESAGLADEAAFQRAVGVLQHDEVIAWGYADAVDSMEAQAEIAGLQMEQLMAEMEEQDPEMAAEFGDMDMSGMMMGLQFLEEIDYDLLREYLGPSAWEAVSTEDGFIVKSYMLSAQPY
ncbi:MAG: hypothetical protein SYC29_03955 [Planctomycetota bacterium]|nr:hypothetical protein [Planctomycetota bacterium]